MTIGEYRNRIIGVRENLISWTEEILDDVDIVKLVQEQLAEGQKGDNTLLPLYSARTIQDKRERNAILTGERISLIDSGAFWNSFFATIYQGGIEVDAKDWKRDMLVERYGEAIFMISQKQMTEIARIVRPLLEKKINEYLR